MLKNGRDKNTLAKLLFINRSVRNISDNPKINNQSMMAYALLRIYDERTTKSLYLSVK